MNDTMLNESFVDIESRATSISNSSSEDAWEFQFRDTSRVLVHRFLVPIVVLVGVLGNLVTIYILTRRPMRSSTNVYLTAMAVSDLLFLTFTFSLSLSHYEELTSQWWLYWSYKPIGLWLNDASSNTSVWLTVSFTIERYIAVCHPMRGKILCTEERAIKVAVFVYLVCFLVTCPTPFEWTIVTTVNDNQETVYQLANTEFGMSMTYVIAYNWFSSIMFTLLPVVILSIFNFLLILAVRQSRITRKAMTSLPNSSARHLQAMRQENRITITLIAVVIVFLICQLPTAIYLIYRTFHHEQNERERALSRGLGGVFNLLMAINAACNFLLYTALSDKYRKYFCTFFICWHPRGRRYGENPYEMDTVNTTLRMSESNTAICVIPSVLPMLCCFKCSRLRNTQLHSTKKCLSRGTSLRADNLSSCQITPKSSPYGLRRTQTCNSNSRGSPNLSRVQGLSPRNNIQSRLHHITDNSIPLIQVDQV